jgi:hypothetical protein
MSSFASACSPAFMTHRDCPSGACGLGNLRVALETSFVPTMCARTPEGLSVRWSIWRAMRFALFRGTERESSNACEDPPRRALADVVVTAAPPRCGEPGVAVAAAASALLASLHHSTRRASAPSRLSFARPFSRRASDHP